MTQTILVEIDPNVLIGSFVGLIAVIGAAIAFIVKLSMRVNSLEKRLDDHPLLRAFRDMEHEQLVSTLSNILSNSHVERQNNG
jgi:hypothetical protein